MEREYRQRDGSDVWHFRADCHNWPEEPVSYRMRVVNAGRPSGGELCNECQAKARKARKRGKK